MTITIAPRHASLLWFAASVAAIPITTTTAEGVKFAVGVSVGASILFIWLFYNLEYEWVRIE